MEQFDAKKIEVFIQGQWVDLTPDVLITPGLRVTGVGIMGNSIVDRVGGAAVCTFSLNNSSDNSAGTLGYYTPSGTSAMTGWTTGLPVHVYFEYAGIRRYKYYGTIDPDGIAPTTGLYGTRDVKVRCSNWMQRASNHKLDLLGYQINKTIDQAVPYILGNMAQQPQQVYYYPGQETFATVFDITRTNSKALGEISKLVFSEFGRAFIKADGQNGETLVIEDNDWYSRKSDDGSGDVSEGTLIPVHPRDVTSNLLLVSGDDLLQTDNTSFILLNETQRAEFAETDIEDMRWDYGKNQYNHVVFKTYPRRIDAAATTVLWALEEPITLEAGEQVVDVRGSYRDPNGGFAKVNGIEMVTPVSGTDYAMFANADGTGTNYTSSLGIIAEYGTAEVRYTLTNNSASTAYVTTLQARGKGVYIYDTSDKAYDHAEYQNRYGVISLDIDMPYLSGVTSLFNFASKTNSIWTSLLNGVGFPIPSVSGVTMTVNKSSKQMLAFMCLEPQDFMIIDETITATNSFGNYLFPYIINGYDFEIVGGQYVKWTTTLKIQGIR